jgi:serine phosphatase RsbU (regulator of sigma subunit)/ligand-binding sensor domain-containing protein
MLLFAITIYPQENYVFEHFSIPEGLSNPTVFSILQDSYGFIWIGTADGLNRYEGYEFKVYKNDPADSMSLPGGGEIWAISEDADKNLWIGGQSFLVLYDRVNDNFKKVTMDLSYYINPSPLVYSILTDSKNRVWISTQNHGVQLINPRNLTTQYQKLIIDGKEAKMNMNFSIIEIHTGEVITSDMANGVLKFNEDDNVFEKYDISDVKGSNLPLKLFEDEMNNIWIANWQGNLQRYNPAENITETIDIYGSVEKQSSDPSIVEIFRDQDGFIWFGTFTNGLFRYNPVSDEFNHFTSNTSKPNGINANEISSIIQDQFGNLWVGTFSSGVNKVDPKKQPFNVYQLPKEIRKNTRDDNITAIYKDTFREDVWIGTFGTGLVRMNLNNDDFKVYSYNANSPNSLGSNHIATIAGDGNKNVWIGTDSSVNKLNTTTGAVEEYLLGETTLGQQFRVNDIKIDNTGRVYVANTNGIQILYPLQKQVKDIATINNRKFDDDTISDLKNELTDEFVLSESKKVIIICGGEGVLTTSLSYDFGWLENESGETIWSMEDAYTSFHLGGGMKNRLKIGAINLTPGKYKLNYRSDIGHSYGNWNVEAPEDSSFWGIRIIELDDKQFNTLSGQINSEIENKDYMPMSGALYISFSNKHENILWIGSIRAGLIKYNLLNQNYEQYIIDSSGAIDADNNNVAHILEDSNGDIWFSSIKGLGYLQTESGEIKFFTQKDGLPTNYVSAFQEDNYGNIWISSVAGLTMMVRGNESERETFVNIDLKDGLQGYTFSRAIWKNEIGELYFGGRNGFNVFLPGKTNQALPEIVFTDMKISDQSVLTDIEDSPLTMALNDTKALTLSFSQNDIAFSFAPIHFSRPERNQIAYMLEDFNEDWIYSKMHYASFTNLDPGEYIFRLKAANGDGIWSNKEKQIAITILPPWWKTTFAYIMYGLFIIGGFVGLDHFQRRRLMSKARERAKIKDAEMRAQLAEAENDRKSKELEEARQLQLSMLPKELPQLPNLDIAVYMKTATEVGGDYYDFNVGMDGTLTVVIGDATGHGMKAGTMVTAAKSLFNTHAANPDILFTFNEITRCIKKMHIHMLSMCLTILKIQGNNIEMSAAGMPPALIYRKQDMAVEEVVLKGMPLGAVSDFPYKLKQSTINPGDTMLLLSDGLPELFKKDREMFSYERVVQEFSKCAHKSPEEIIEDLKTAGSDWVEDEDPDDDVTFVVIKVK